jgi:aspartate/methionine/tyrosine aminotransferase
LPFTGRDDLKEAVAAYIERRGGPRYDSRREIVITSGEGDAMLDALFCLTDPGDEEWNAIASTCCDQGLWLLYWGGFEAVLYDDRPIHQPAALPGMRDRTVTVGAPSLEQRMIAWRVGWVVAPDGLFNDMSRIQIYNGLVPSGFAQIGTKVALGLPDDHLMAANREYQRRRDETLRQLDGLPVVRPAGGWALLIDVAALGLDCVAVSHRLVQEKVAATPMRGWGGDIADRRIRFVFSNEPVERLHLLGDRVRRALAV